jgi:hypothetical protein
MEGQIHDREFRSRLERAIELLDDLDDHAYARANARHDRNWAIVGDSCAGAASRASEVCALLNAKKLIEPTPENERQGGCYGTFTNVIFYPMDPRSEEVRPEDIAHALSNRARWSGHSKRFYSVAEHSLRVMAVATELAIERRISTSLVGPYGLLHDANEAYLPDVPRPVKPFIPGWLAIEARVQEVALERFSLPPPPAEVAEIVDDADAILLSIEARELFDEDHYAVKKIPPIEVSPAVECAAKLGVYGVFRPFPTPEDWDEVVMLRLLRELLIARAVPDPKAVAARRDPWKNNVQAISGAELRGEPPAHLRRLLEGD